MCDEITCIKQSQLFVFDYMVPNYRQQVAVFPQNVVHVSMADRERSIPGESENILY